jgi:hypothetical protein
VDRNGVRGDQPAFDKSNVAVYGLGLNASGGGFGQTEWSEYAFSNGWSFADKNPWGAKWNYGDAKFIEIVAWWQGLAMKGYMPTLQVAGGGALDRPSGGDEPGDGRDHEPGRRAGLAQGDQPTSQRPVQVVRSAPT